MDALHRSAGVAATTVLADSGTRLLSGLGGVGKTQLAVHLVMRLELERAVDLVVWVRAATRQAIIQHYAQAAADLGLQGARGLEIELDASRFHAFLAATDVRWLVVLDDVTNVADLRGLWPPDHAGGRTVVTTRLREPALDGHNRHLISLGEFTPDEGRHYLENRLRNYEYLADDPDGVSSDLGHLPLALSQAAAYMISEDIPCSAYRALFADRRRRLDDLVPSPDRLPDDYDRTVAAALLLSIDASERTEPGGRVPAALLLASLLDPNGIPEVLLTSSAAGGHMRAHWAAEAGMEDDTSAMRRALRSLHRMNVITLNRGIVTIHALVQRVVLEHFGGDLVENSIRAAADGLLEIWSAVEYDGASSRPDELSAKGVHRQNPGRQYLHANALKLWRNATSVLVQPETHLILSRLAASLVASGQNGAANAYLTDLIAIVERYLGSDHDDALVLRSLLGDSHLGASAWNSAVEVYGHLYADSLRIHGAAHELTLTVRNNLARATGHAGNAAAAVRELEALLVDNLRAVGPDGVRTLLTRNNLAYWRGRANDVPGAMLILVNLIPDMVRVLGADHRETLKSRSNLAIWQRAAGDPAGAADALEDLLPALIRVIGADHPDTLVARRNIAVWRSESGDSEGALRVLLAVAEEQERVLDINHPDLLETLDEVSQLQEQTGDPAGAVRSIERFLPGLDVVFGPDSLRSLSARRRLARCRGSSGDATGAARSLEALLADLRRAHSHRISLKSKVVAELAYWRFVSGDMQGAMSAMHDFVEPSDLDEVSKVFRFAADAMSSEFGPDHPVTLQALSARAFWQGEGGDPLGAAETWAQIVPKLHQSVGKDTIQSFAARYNYARYIRVAGNLQQSMELSKELLDDILRIFGPDHELALTVRANRAWIFGEQGDFPSASSAFDELLADRERLLGADHPDTITAGHSAALYRALNGNHVSAIDLFEHVLAASERVLGPEHKETDTTRAELAYWKSHRDGLSAAADA